jgi:hypothetical protein
MADSFLAYPPIHRSLISREDQGEFFESLAAMLFGNAKPYAEVAHVLKVCVLWNLCWVLGGR